MNAVRLFRSIKLVNLFSDVGRKSLNVSSFARKPVSVVRLNFSTVPALRRLNNIQNELLRCSSHDKKQSSDNSSRDEGSSTGGDEDEVPSGELMAFQWRMFPSPWWQVKNWMCEKLIIQAHFDYDFSLKTFKEGAKQALVSVSADLAAGRVEALGDRVTPEAVAVLRRSVARLSLAERQRLRVRLDDISLAFPHQLGVIMEGEGGSTRVWAEVTMCFHIIRNFETLVQRRMRDQSFDAGSAVRDGISFANYRFIREITKGVEDDWKVNVLNHFSPKNQFEQS